MALQLELDLWQQLNQAEAVPVESNLQQLHERLDLVVSQLPLEEKLATAGTALLQMAEILSRRAEVFLRDWRDAHNDDGPILDLDDEMGMVRQSMVLDDDLIAEPDPVTRRTLPKEECESIVVLKDKASLLGELETELRVEQLDEVLQVLEEEDVLAWVHAISTYLQGTSGMVPIAELMQELQLSLVPIWLGMLLGGFQFEQRGGFYDQNVWIEAKISISKS
ncbi:hypothetical protein [Acaryochloris sp. CCMEE 5410]|uniref:hypothetical protein n=1 Tax=Acaryochloris sp. CCMEE 5410 TaxID=310037 RepID=UPI0002485058|nr:hypothetical protein [Acaryochloris sp. CCMEE 5410]KAI9129504.1 hypothetical protein ON05_032835 [Acaryochloris sp. CCMEE 5410]